VAGPSWALLQLQRWSGVLPGKAGLSVKLGPLPLEEITGAMHVILHLNRAASGVCADWERLLCLCCVCKARETIVIKSCGIGVSVDEVKRRR
jgi:hypothetical protein